MVYKYKVTFRKIKWNGEPSEYTLDRYFNSRQEAEAYVQSKTITDTQITEGTYDRTGHEIWI